MLVDEYNKLKTSKTLIRKAIQRKLTGLPTTEIFSGYPPYIQAVHQPVRTVNSEGMIDYSEDGTSIFTVTTNSIRDFAFADYTALKYLVIQSDEFVELQGIHAFLNTLIGNNNGNIYVPANMVDTYKAAENWSHFADLITSGTVPDEVTTNLIEHEEAVRTRTVEWFNALTVEEIITDNRT